MTVPYRSFPTGATRDSSENKIDPEGFLSPSALEFYCSYMNKHRKMSDGSIRASDNWQLGIPPEECMKSAWRHFLEVWKAHRSGVKAWDSKEGEPQNLEESICGVIFNMFALLHQELQEIEFPAGKCPTKGCSCRDWAAETEEQSWEEYDKYSKRLRAWVDDTEFQPHGRDRTYKVPEEQADGFSGELPEHHAKNCECYDCWSEELDD